MSLLKRVSAVNGSIASRAYLHIRRVASHPVYAKDVGQGIIPPGSKAAEDASDRERFYHYYLTLKSRPIRFRPCSVILSLDHETCRRALPLQLQENPLAAFDSQTTTLNEATQSLEALITRAYHDGGAPKLRQVVCRNKAGTIALIWYLKSGLYDRSDPNNEQPRFFRALTLCMSAEDADIYLWKWILTKDPGSDHDNPDRYRARGDLLRWMLEAQAYWAPPSAPLEKSLDTFTHALNTTSKRELYFPTKLAGNWIEGALTSDVSGTVSAARYDRFAQQVRFYKKDARTAGLSNAIVSLYHPKLDPSYALAYWKEAPQQQDQYTRALLSTPRPATQQLVFWHLLRLAQMLRQLNDTINAQWVLDFGERYFPDIFNRRLGPNERAGSQIDAHHMRPPTESELALGLETGDRTAELRRLAVMRKLRGFK
ncbi:hypothetical protein LTR17_006024 [Elasticomyces elasticus]|nr:hypothetical protein LTR17_006024 [Elasticomyces elasticus]